MRQPSPSGAGAYAISDRLRRAGYRALALRSRRAHPTVIGRQHPPLPAVRWQAIAGRRTRISAAVRLASSRPLADSSRARVIASIKSLLSFDHRLGYVRFNIGAPLTLPKRRNSSLGVAQVVGMFAVDANGRTAQFFERSRRRAARQPLVALRWRDLQEAR